MQTIRSSRWAALFGLGLTPLFFPHLMLIDDAGVRTSKRRLFLIPWLKTEEFMGWERIASVVHNKGLIWDVVVVETSGGSNNLDIRGVRKRDASGVARTIQERLSD